MINLGRLKKKIILAMVRAIMLQDTEISHNFYILLSLHWSTDKKIYS